MNIYTSKVNYLPQSKLFLNSQIMKWDFILPYNYRSLFYQTLREDLDEHVTNVRVLNYHEKEEYSNITDLKGGRYLMITETDIQLPFPFRHLRKYFYSCTCEYDKESETIYVYQKPFLKEDLRNMNPSIDKVKMKGFPSKLKKEQEKDCYLYFSFEIFVFKKISESQTLYQRIHITPINEWNLSLMLNYILTLQGKEIRSFCHQSQKKATTKEDIKNEKGRAKIAYDLELPED